MPDTKCRIPIGKLNGVSHEIRIALKLRSINTSRQLLAVAARHEDREALARAMRVPPTQLTTAVRRADMARIRGIGATFVEMLAELGIHDVAMLATQEPDVLHERLRQYNRSARFVRRPPNLEEIQDWIGQARRLPRPLSYAMPEVALAS